MKNVSVQTESKLTVNLISQLTMSSREIAELCEKEHKNVKRDIVNLCSELEIDALKFERIYKDAKNRELLGKETKSFHYSNENLMLNEIVLGERRSFAEDELSPIDVQQLEEARTLNGALIKLDTPYKERKAKLMAWGQRLATIALSPTT